MATRTGTPGPDYLFPFQSFFFRPANDIIYGLAGNDTILGLRGDDSLSGGVGDDCLYGGTGNDLLYGATGSDSLDGGTGNDGLYGGEGDDSLDGGTGNDYLNGGDGFDPDLRVAHFRPDASGYDDYPSGNDLLSGGTGDDYLVGGSGNDLLNGGDGIDTVSYNGLGDTGVYLQLGAVGDGSGLGRASDWRGDIDSLSGIEVAIGSWYNDTLLGGDGSETLIGGMGNDLLFGLSGNDYLVGGTGSDKFRLWRGWGIDTIADFQQGQDKLLVRSRAPFADIISESVINGSDTEIRQNGQIIGILKGVRITITASDLITG
ncbi:calcium-binding protein [Microcoleus vaginatus]|uniref:calcium-binding protein n=1 Tax=Microcoleus vaginatus TaxID=119532 RepID=UPI004040990D